MSSARPDRCATSRLAEPRGEGRRSQRLREDQSRSPHRRTTAGRVPRAADDLQSIALHDTLVVRAVRGVFGITCDMPGVPIDRTNLVWRAADALWKAAGRRGRVRGASIELKKRVPPQAGLGGGSSDAAATLLALNALWRLRLSPDDLHGVAATLGSDVPFFLVGGTALGLGRGEQLYALPDVTPSSIVLVQPPFRRRHRRGVPLVSRSRHTPEIASTDRARVPLGPQVRSCCRERPRACSRRQTS